MFFEEAFSYSNLVLDFAESYANSFSLKLSVTTASLFADLVNESTALTFAALADFNSVLAEANFEFKLSTRDPDKSVGTDEIWGKATNALREALERHGVDYSVKEGDAAFYGPKIDIDVRDAIGRKWQLSTIQCDFNLPERFGLEYIGADNARHRPIMLHRALFGSVERFFGVLLEHYGGAFPTWLAPVQVRVLAVTSGHEAYAQSLVDKLVADSFRVDTSTADEQLGKRIRSAKLERIPFVLVVGDDDVANQTVGVNPRGGEVIRGVKFATFVDQLRAETKSAANISGLQG